MELVVLILFFPCVSAQSTVNGSAPVQKESLFIWFCIMPQETVTWNTLKYSDQVFWMYVCNTTNAALHTTQGSIRQSKKKVCIYNLTSLPLRCQSEIGLNLGSCPGLPPSYICQTQTMRPNSRAILKKSWGSSPVPRLPQEDRRGSGKATSTSSQSSRRHLMHLSHRMGAMHRATFQLKV